MNEALWEKASQFHGHKCPGLAIGFRTVEAVREKMGVSQSEDEELVCVTENDACGVDAIQALLSCTFGKGNLIYKGSGKQAFNFFARSNGKKLRVCLKPNEHRNKDRDAWQDYLLNAPLDEIFSFSEPTFDLPERARIFNTLVCDVCGEGAPEHKMRLQDGKTVCLDCFNAYDRGW
jgi:formylmethanofuran dehydrogenase subunit E